MLRAIPNEDKIIIHVDFIVRVCFSHHTWPMVLGKFGKGEAYISHSLQISVSTEHQLVSTDTLSNTKKFRETPDALKTHTTSSHRLHHQWHFDLPYFLKTKAIIKVSVRWKSNLTDEMKRSFFQAMVVLILLYGCTTWTLTKRLEKKLNGNYTRILRAILNKPWRQHLTKHQLYGHLPLITKTIQVRRTRHAGHCWRSRVKLISDVLLWTLTYGRVKAGRPARTYIQQPCEDTGFSPEDLPESMNNREKWRERVRDIRASGTTWWWWLWQYWLVYGEIHYQITSDAENEEKKTPTRKHITIASKINRVRDDPQASQNNR